MSAGPNNILGRRVRLLTNGLEGTVEALCDTTTAVESGTKTTTHFRILLDNGMHVNRKADSIELLPEEPDYFLSHSDGSGNYLLLVETEPLPGVTARRVYGPYQDAAAVWADLYELGIVTPGAPATSEAVKRNPTSLKEGYVGAGYLLLRDPITLNKERP